MKNIFSRMFIVFTILALLFISVSVVNAGGTASPTNFDNTNINGAGCSGLVCCVNPPDCDFTDFKNTVANIILKLLQLCLAAVSLMFAYVGYEYLMSQDNAGRRQKAHGMLTKAGIGLIIVLTAFLIVELITRTLGLDVGIIQLIK